MMQYHYVSFIYQLQQKHVIKKCIKFLMREYIINIYNIKINSYKNIYMNILVIWRMCYTRGSVIISICVHRQRIYAKIINL